MIYVDAEIFNTSLKTQCQGRDLRVVNIALASARLRLGAREKLGYLMGYNWARHEARFHFIFSHNCRR